uniref:TolB family protein n=1 Tax=Anaeromyxobacter terrae TaxID=2925406 RepID=UPI001F5971AE
PAAPPAPTAAPAPAPGARDLALPGERHLRNVRQLTFGGENAEAYFSFDGRELVFQATPEGAGCDRLYVMRADGSGRHQVSSGKGRVTCGYFFPTGERLLYSSTHASGAECPPKPDLSQGYVWALFDYQLYTARPDGSDLAPLAPAPGAYSAEATISRDGWIVFTSTRDGDLELYKMRLDGSGLVRLTHTPGYDGGAFFSADGARIVFRASRPASEAELAEYRRLLAQKLVRPGKLEIYVMNADGSGVRQVTRLGAASFAPFFHPDGRRIVFASNVGDPKGRNFDLYLVNDDGSGLERITTNDTFDGFPMFSPDGRTLVFASNRNARRPGETNVFVADWVE